MPDPIPAYPAPLPPVPDDLPDECARIAYLAQVQYRAQTAIEDAQRTSSDMMRIIGSTIDEPLVEAEQIANEMSSILTGQITQIFKVIKNYRTRLISLLQDTLIGSLAEANAVAEEMKKIGAQQGVSIRPPSDVLKSGGEPKPGQPILTNTPSRTGSTSSFRYPDLSEPYFAPEPEPVPGRPPSATYQIRPSEALLGPEGAAQLGAGLISGRPPQQLTNAPQPTPGGTATLPPLTIASAAEEEASLQAGVPVFPTVSVSATFDSLLKTLEKLQADIESATDRCEPSIVEIVVTALDDARAQANSLWSGVLETLRTLPSPGTPEAIGPPATEELPVDIDQPIAFLFGQRGDAWHKQAVAWFGDWLGAMQDSATLGDFVAVRGEPTDKVDSVPLDGTTYPYE